MKTGTGSYAYEEFGKKWIWGFYLNQGGHYLCQVGKEELGYLRGLFNVQGCKFEMRRFPMECLPL